MFQPVASPCPAIRLGPAELLAQGSGVLWWGAERLLAVADLHLGRAERLARRGGGLIPPWGTEDTLDRLSAAVEALAPATVVCLGDSFDDLAAARDIAGRVAGRLARLAAGRRWIWIAGNHDPGPLDLPGTHLAELRQAGLTFRHIAGPGETGPEVSAHYHPKAVLWRRGTRISRPCFLAGGGRVILPAFGTYTGGLDARDRCLDPLVGAQAIAILTGPAPVAIARSRLG